MMTTTSVNQSKTPEAVLAWSPWRLFAFASVVLVCVLVVSWMIINQIRPADATGSEDEHRRLLAQVAMFILYGFWLALLFMCMPAFLRQLYQKSGFAAVYTLLMALIAMMSAAVWLLVREVPLPNGEGLPEGLYWLNSLPWGTIWIVVTFLFIGLYGFAVWTSRDADSFDSV